MKLSDSEIREIFERVDDPSSDASQFVKAFARAVRLAPRADFMIMRPVTLIVIGKYKLGHYADVTESQRSHCTNCDDTGWRPVEGIPDRRVTRCECRLRKTLERSHPPAVDRSAEPGRGDLAPIASASEPRVSRFDFKSAAAGDL
jgi:hypothetical protein